MRTIAEATKIPGITRAGKGLNLHFSPIPNWYSCIAGVDCPICDTEISWKWIGRLPDFTGDNTPSHVKPEIVNAKLLTYGHRWIMLECHNCRATLTLENFD